MEKNYYDILEVSKYASPEIIEKAYKTLVKKYHPDLQEDNLKSEYEQKLKLINEAYDVLSNNEKKSKYDQELAQIEEKKKIAEEQTRQQNFSNQQNRQNYNQNQNNQINKQHFSGQRQEIYQQPEQEIKQSYLQPNNPRQQYTQQSNYNEEYTRRMNAAINKAYHDAYIQDLKNRGYKIRYKKTLKDYITNFISLLILIVIFIILWQIPFVRKFFINMYNENPFLKAIVDAFIIMLEQIF